MTNIYLLRLIKESQFPNGHAYAAHYGPQMPEIRIARPIPDDSRPLTNETVAKTWQDSRKITEAAESWWTFKSAIW